MSGIDIVDLRETIAAVDGDIAGLLARRLRLAKQLGALKREADLDAYAPTQEVLVYERFRAALGDEAPVMVADVATLVSELTVGVDETVETVTVSLYFGVGV